MIHSNLVFPPEGTFPRLILVVPSLTLKALVPELLLVNPCNLITSSVARVGDVNVSSVVAPEADHVPVPSLSLDVGVSISVDAKAVLPRLRRSTATINIDERYFFIKPGLSNPLCHCATRFDSVFIIQLLAYKANAPYSGAFCC